MSKLLPIELQNVDSIGEVNAEEDAVLQYFLDTDATSKVSNNRAYLVLGRKGAGKTALVRHFTKDETDVLSRALNLRSYAWNIHQQMRDVRGSEIEAYVASWRYVIATQAATGVLDKYPNEIGDGALRLRKFFRANYGDAKVDLSKIFSIPKLIFSAATIEPKLAGASFGSLSFAHETANFGYIVNSVTDEIISLVLEIMTRRGTPKVTLHFDELDSGIETLERARIEMIAGLVLAAQSIRRSLGGRNALIQPFVYLREDIWQGFAFSDRNKITYGASQRILWDSSKLLDLVNLRIRSISNTSSKFEDLIDGQQMPSKQNKWDYILARTHDRPRDVIAFINLVLQQRVNRHLAISNADFHAVKAAYSSYFKGEVEDEIKAYWPNWEDAIRAIGDIGYVSFGKSAFTESYLLRRTADNPIIDSERALEILYNYSVISFLRTRPTGGSDWIWKYKQPDQYFDAKADRYKVHSGFQEYANLRTERRSKRTTVQT